MLNFKVKVHQIVLWLGLHPRPRWGAYSAPPDPLAGFKGPTSKRGEGKGGEWEGRAKGVEERRGRQGRGGQRGREGRDPKVWLTPPCSKS